ncbi:MULTISPECIES: C40 family peptidase [unclassified Gilliamella]|uniref:C40 family peptidase n=1 Tax=unclassified Gilliamella TaxID=2685620 RepID=UPI00226A884B|nr:MULTISPECIES: C40 family peptidase [unclassified Gilliamella]MCX8642363.1 C40 family peptidase [Gilliamella sp. B3835]MCX8707761.1 C40 family peptidase [Gilliamella sp. B3783]MCX8709334.1 C40 family peptidase [Gilliamella sp. B3780]MCX8711625.1 C40 family peptidase [Gilliamella sp. B3468]MCX8715220.1 C40 family peptidase [Gilliamella sp. B3781]
MTKKDNRRSSMLPNNFFSVKKRFLITTLLFSLFMLFGCSTSQGQVSTKTTKPDPQMLAKIESHYKKWQKTPYRFGGTTLSGSDCSGLVVNFFKNKLSKTLPRSASAQAQLGYKVSQPKAGDLVFFKTGRSQSGLHVGIYYADGKFLHASTSKGVIYSSLNEDYWKKHYWMTRRLTDG